MTDHIEPGLEPETAPAGLEDILEQSGPALSESVKAEKAAREEPAQTAEPKAAPEAESPEKSEPFWYRKALKEREKREKEQARRLEELERQLQAREQQRAGPDARQDPVRYFETQRVMDRLERSEDRFIDRHGEQQLEEVRDWMAAMPPEQRDSFEQYCMNQRHPWGAAHAEFQKARLAAEIGDDPAAWRKRQEEEITARIREEMAAQYGQQPGGAPSMRLPQPASGQRSAAPRSGPGFAGPTPLGEIINKR